jgi:FkbM family methyltransferase
MKDELIVEVQRVARRLGVDVRRRQPSEADRVVALMDRMGVSLAADVGANVGDWARAIRDAGFGGRIVSVEPLDEPFRRLSGRAARDTAWVAVRCAAGAAPGSATINVSATSQSSSLLAMEQPHLEALPSSRYVATEEVAVRRLDEILSGHVTPDARLFVKLDVQGFEEHALAGLGELRPQVMGLQAELALVPLYAGQPEWRSFLERMEREGFGLFALNPAFVDPRTGQTLQIDAVFTRR